MVMFYIHFHSLKGLEPGHGDRVGLYRLPFLQVDLFGMQTLSSGLISML